MGHLSTRFASDTMCGHWQYRNVNGAHVSLEICGSLGEVKGERHKLHQKARKDPRRQVLWKAGARLFPAVLSWAFEAGKDRIQACACPTGVRDPGTLCPLILPECSDEAGWEKHHVSEEINS